jgi:hypothetical protein
VTVGAPLAAHCQCGAEGVRYANGWTRFFREDFCPACWQEKQRVEAENRERHFREEQERKQAWKARNAEVADCPRCDKKNLRVRLPRDGRQVGDGTMYITYWHKAQSTGRDCRAEVDVEDVRVVERATRSRRREQTPPSDGDRMT